MRPSQTKVNAPWTLAFMAHPSPPLLRGLPWDIQGMVFDYLPLAVHHSIYGEAQLVGRISTEEHSNQFLCSRPDGRYRLYHVARRAVAYRFRQAKIKQYFRRGTDVVYSDPFTKD